MKHQVDVHAWVLMTNHVHLLCTPWKENAISRMMQSIGRLYVRYYNHTYQRSGTSVKGSVYLIQTKESAGFHQDLWPPR